MAAELVKANGSEEAPREVPTLRPDRAYFVEQRMQNLLIVAPAGLKASDVANPVILQPLQKMLQPYSLLYIVDDEDRWIVEAMVRNNLPGKCSLVILRTIDLPPRDSASGIVLPEDVKIRQGGPAVGWLVERKNTDGSVIVMGKGCDHPEWRSERDVHDWYWAHASVRQTVAAQRRLAS